MAGKLNIGAVLRFGSRVGETDGVGSGLAMPVVKPKTSLPNMSALNKELFPNYNAEFNLPLLKNAYTKRRTTENYKSFTHANRTRMKRQIEKMKRELAEKRAAEQARRESIRAEKERIRAGRAGKKIVVVEPPPPPPTNVFPRNAKILSNLYAKLAPLEAEFEHKKELNYKTFSRADRTHLKKQIELLRRQISLYESLPLSKNLLSDTKISLDDSDFKYTTNFERRNNVKKMYPVFLDLARLPFLIDWKSYRYVGPCTLLQSIYDEDTDTGKDFLKTVNVDVSYNHIDKDYSAYKRKDCFYFFGGCCYEILNRAIKHDNLLADSLVSNEVVEYVIPNLHDLVDPTGDIDIIPRRPYIKVDDDDEYLDYDFSDLTQTNFSQWFLHWIHWIHKSVCDVFLDSDARKAMRAITTPFKPEENEEIKGATILQQMQIDNVWIMLIRKDSMVKIQIAAKIVGSSMPEHFVEFVIALADVTHEQSSLKNGKTTEFLNQTDNNSNLTLFTMDLGNVRIQSFYELFKGNLSGMEARYTLVETNASVDPTSNVSKENMSHKFYNHVQRLRYINEIFPYFMSFEDDLKKIKSLPPWMMVARNPAFLSRLEELIKFLNSMDVISHDGVRKKICLFNYDYLYREPADCTLKQVEDSLTNGIVPTLQKIMTRRVDPGLFPELNRLIGRSKSKTQTTASETQKMEAPVAMMQMLPNERRRKTRRPNRRYRKSTRRIHH